MTTTKRWTIAEVEALPDDGTKYELLDGELYPVKAGHPNHQKVTAEIGISLGIWNRQTDLGTVYYEPGLVFTDESGVIPDIAWMSNMRETQIYHNSKLRGPAELVIEVLSPGSENEKRDKHDKLALYSRRGVDEYWIVDWRKKTVEIFRRAMPNSELTLVAVLGEKDSIVSPTLPGFAGEVKYFFKKLLHE